MIRILIKAIFNTTILNCESIIIISIPKPFQQNFQIHLLQFQILLPCYLEERFPFVDFDDFQNTEPTKTGADLSFRMTYSISPKCCSIFTIFGSYYSLSFNISYMFLCSRNSQKCSQYCNFNIFKLPFFYYGVFNFVLICIYDSRTCKSTFYIK